MRELRDRASLGKRGAQHVAIIFSSGHCLLLLAPAPSLARFLPHPPLPQNSCKYGCPDDCSAPYYTLSNCPWPATLSYNQDTNFSHSPRDDSHTIFSYQTHIGTVWSHWEPAVRWSSPAHPRSWQAPTCFTAGPESARRFAHSVDTTYVFP